MPDDIFLTSCLKSSTGRIDGQINVPGPVKKNQLCPKVRFPARKARSAAPDVFSTLLRRYESPLVVPYFFFKNNCLNIPAFLIRTTLKKG